MLNPMVTKHIEQGEDELEVDIFFDFQPEERTTYDYPGCDAAVDICEVILVESGAEICFLKDIESSMEEEILVDHYDNLKRCLDLGDERW